jgi:hypothetical protein
VSRAGDVDRIQVALADRAVQVDVDQVETGRRPEVAEQARLDVLGGKRLAQQRVVEQVDLRDGEVVRRPPVRVDPAQLGAGQGRPLGCARRARRSAPPPPGTVPERDLLPTAPRVEYSRIVVERLDEERLELLRSWGAGLSTNARDELRAAGKAILMLIDEVERLQVDAWNARAAANAASQRSSQSLASALRDRLAQRPLPDEPTA